MKIYASERENSKESMFKFFKYSKTCGSPSGSDFELASDFEKSE